MVFPDERSFYTAENTYSTERKPTLKLSRPHSINIPDTLNSFSGWSLSQLRWEAIVGNRRRAFQSFRSGETIPWQ